MRGKSIQPLEIRGVPEMEGIKAGMKRMGIEST